MWMSAPVKTASKAAPNLASRSRIKNRNWSAWSPRSISRLRACWVTQAPVGWAVIPAMWTRRRVLDYDEDVEPAQEDGVDVGEVDGEDRVGLRGEELAPGRSRPLRCGVDACGLEDLPDGGGGDLMAESDQLAVNASVAPAGVLAGHPQHQIANDLGDRWTAWCSSPIGPASGDELGVPPQQRSW